MAKILVLEDDASIRKLVKVNLERANFEVIEATRGEEALVLFKDHADIDIALLDVMLPTINGFEVCRRIRDRNAIVGILMLTAKGQEQDKLLGLDSGADDYITKPFSPAELVARVKALYRRIRVNEEKYIEEVIEDGVFKLNVNTRQCFKSGEEIILTPTEFLLLKVFITSNNEVLTRETLLKTIWGENFYGDYKIVDVNIRRLRRKIESNPSSPDYIATAWGKGYKWVG